MVGCSSTRLKVYYPPSETPDWWVGEWKEVSAKQEQRAKERSEEEMEKIGLFLYFSSLTCFLTIWELCVCPLIFVPNGHTLGRTQTKMVCWRIHAPWLIAGLWNLQVVRAKQFLNGCQAVAVTAGHDIFVIVEMMPALLLIWDSHLCQLETTTDHD